MSHAIVLLGMDDLTLEVAGYVADLDAGGDPRSPGTGYRITDVFRSAETFAISVWVSNRLSISLPAKR